ncbi:MAG TPA: hypothetical protein VGF82_16150 [Terracidiphilus sp.]
MRRISTILSGFRWCPAILVLICLVLAITSALLAEPIKVRHPEGTLHGFLSLSTAKGEVLAAGDLVEVVREDRVTARLTFHFKDGSLDDETTVYSQRGVFRLVSDHHIQRGPYFPHPLEMTIDVAKGTVVTRTSGKDGKPQVSTEHMKLPADLYNGLVTPIIKNLRTELPETKVSMIVATPKPRIVTLAIFPHGEEPFSVAGISRKALACEIKIELGGVAGLIAPVIGKQPPDFHMWTEGGEVPVFLRETGPIFEGGDILIINLIGPAFPKNND